MSSLAAKSRLSKKSIFIGVWLLFASDMRVNIEVYPSIVAIVARSSIENGLSPESLIEA